MRTRDKHPQTFSGANVFRSRRAPGVYPRLSREPYEDVLCYTAHNMLF